MFRQAHANVHSKGACVLSIAIERETRAEARSAPNDLGLAEDVLVSVGLACLKLLRLSASLTDSGSQLFAGLDDDLRADPDGLAHGNARCECLTGRSLEEQLIIV